MKVPGGWVTVGHINNCHAHSADVDKIRFETSMLEDGCRTCMKRRNGLKTGTRQDVTAIINHHGGWRRYVKNLRTKNRTGMTVTGEVVKLG